jgi:hypothetical protein
MKARDPRAFISGQAFGTTLEWDKKTTTNERCAFVRRHRLFVAARRRVNPAAGRCHNIAQAGDDDMTVASIAPSRYMVRYGQHQSLPELRQ